MVVLHTDGMPEATDRAGAVFGYERLARFLAALDTGSLTAPEITRAVLADVARFAGGGHPLDDIAVVAIRVLEG